MRKYFATGLLILAPITITVWVLYSIFTTLDQPFLVLLLPVEWRTKYAFTGLSALLVLSLIFFTGLLAHNYFGRYLVQWWDSLLQRIPVVRSIYSSVKQVSDTLLSPSGNAFRQVVLVPYPHPGARTIAFLTGAPGGELAEHLDQEYVSVYVPTTPNPTSGFFLMFPKTDVVELNMSVDTALKYIISMGVVAPETTQTSK
ncbi:DUF502 domain-containing protein [Massilia sp. W12]|uniref:DUF502 domain-containing protein n=1 Tax=Massilia sp. W12 TaxID=3126507 RepID=UPI0030CE6CF3